MEYCDKGEVEYYGGGEEETEHHGSGKGKAERHGDRGDEEE